MLFDPAGNIYIWIEIEDGEVLPKRLPRHKETTEYKTCSLKPHRYL